MAHGMADANYPVSMTEVADSDTMALTSSTNGSSSTVVSRTCGWWTTTSSWWERYIANLTVDGVHASAALYAVMACWSRPRSRLIREVMKEGRPVEILRTNWSKLTPWASVGCPARRTPARQFVLGSPSFTPRHGVQGKPATSPTPPNPVNQAVDAQAGKDFPGLLKRDYRPARS
jgi:hypothetical protein